MSDFYQGMSIGTLLMLILVGGLLFVKWGKENMGWDNKMVIEYRSQKDYDRGIVRDMVDKSQIFTNFVNREIIMDRHCIKYVLTNPETRK